MKKILSGVLITLAVSVLAGMFYLNEIFIPTDLKRTVVEELEAATQKKVLLESLRFSMFKGMVLKGLVLYDDANIILEAKEASCAFLFMPFFRKEIIVPVIRLKSPTILLERRADNSINLMELFNQKYIPKHGYKTVVHRISITGARVRFTDDTITPKFIKKIESLNMHIYLSPPSRVQFDLDFEVPAASPLRVDSSGEYDIAGKRGSAKVVAKDISLEGFKEYYGNLGISIPEGTADALISLSLKDDSISADINGQTMGLVISGDKISARLDSTIKASVRYAIGDKRLSYSGSVKIDDLGISGVEYFENADNIKGDLNFSDSGISSDNISAEIFGIPVEAKVNLAKLEVSLLDIYINSRIKLDALKTILKDRFKINIPADLEGDGKLYLAIQYKISQDAPLKVRGSLEMADATIKTGKAQPEIEKVNGVLQFEANRLMWSDIDFRYLETGYKTSGALTDFEKPGVQLKLSSKDLSLEAVFAVNGKLMTFTKFAGQYIDSGFSLTGGVDISSAPTINADINGTLDVNIDDLKSALKNFKDKLERIKATGRLSADFKLKGNIRDIKSCAIDAKILTNSLSLYDLKPTNVIMEYQQKDGVADIPRIHSFLYGGTLDASARVELVPKGNPYSISADIQGVKLEKLKADTGFRDKDISGSIRMQAKLTGLSNDPASLTGSGKIAVTNGKLWQLNLFKGIGVLLFTSDFSEVLFKEVSAAFIIKEKAVFTDGFWIKSDLVDMYGSARIGFDKNIDASLKAEITNEAFESGARKDITTAIGKYTLIDVTGTLKDPKYKLKPDIGGILGGIQSAVF